MTTCPHDTETRAIPDGVEFVCRTCGIVWRYVERSGMKILTVVEYEPERAGVDDDPRLKLFEIFLDGKV